MNNKISNSVSVVVLIITVALAAFILYQYSNKNIEDISNITPSPIVKKINSGIPSYIHLFETNKKDTDYPQESNIVGYFAEVFVWYVPDWIAQNWIMREFQDEPVNEGMYFVPNEPIVKGGISPIVIDVKKSTESFNAIALFDEEKKGNVIISEVMLNKRIPGTLSINNETDTRIYHVQTEKEGRIYDIYFIDAYTKTARITFSSDKENFPAYSVRIRDMVQGIGEMKVPQG